MQTYKITGLKEFMSKNCIANVDEIWEWNW